MTHSFFRNHSDIATTPARKLALEIASAGLKALAPESLLKNIVRFNRETRALEVAGQAFSPAEGRLFVIGGGKAADVMAAALENLTDPEIITAGLVICKTQSAHPRKIQVRTAGHPVPDAAGVAAVAEVMALKDKHNIGKNDLVLCLLSGGASALMPSPPSGISLGDKQELTRLLLGSGATIAEVNIIRKHLSTSKGGKLGRHFAPATVVSLIVSDVIGNNPADIGSGPTSPETTSPNDAIDLIVRYGLWDRVPAAVRNHLETNTGQQPLNTLPNCSNHVIGDGNTALEAMVQAAKQLGRPVCIISNSIQGQPEAAAREIASRILNGDFNGCDVLLAAGETTPVLSQNPGLGGRNQHFALATLSALKTFVRDWTHLSLGSDGSDYLPDVAGAIVDRGALERMRAEGLLIRDSLDRFDANTLFQKTGGCLVETGPTGTNVGDLMIYVM